MAQSDDLKQSIIEGKTKFHELDRIVEPKAAADIRRHAIEEMTGTQLPVIGNFTIDAKSAASRNIENMIGAIQIPVGIAGPLTINGEYAKGGFYLPLATTEGALVASTNRGCSAISSSGGADVRIFKDGMTRAPVFKTKGAIESKKLVAWVNDADNFKRMQECAATTTRFGVLIAVTPYVAGNNVYLRFIYDTKDAMGMNMVTIATDAVVDMIMAENDAELISLSGNMCTDKKPSAINLIEGRGKTVVADVRLSREIVLKKLKTTPERMVEVNIRKNLVGSALAGSIGFNAHVANVAAAMYLACGQDAAHVVEASLSITFAEVDDNGDLYISVTMPAVSVGTVGGGTGIATQQECLGIIDCAGSGKIPGHNAKKLAEIIASAALAGEISLIGAQAAKHLAQAHQEHGR